MLLDSSQKPQFSYKKIVEIIEEHYGFKAKIAPLDSYMDQNFHVTTNFDKEFILKIARPSESWNSLDAQNKALEFLYKRNWFYHSPTPIQSKSGFDIIQIKGEDGHDYHFRLLRFLQGKLLVDVEPHSPKLLVDLGKFAASLDKTLKDFSHHGAHRQIPWDIKNVMQIQKLAGYITDVERRRILEYFLTQFELAILPKLIQTKSSIIHNDINDYNIIVRDPNTGLPRIYGIFDFGDLTYTHTICELAIAISYVMLEKENPYQAAGYVISGYHQIYPLSETEIELLFHLSAIRLCISVMMSTYRRKHDPNNAYLNVTEPLAWKLLYQMIATSPEYVTSLFRQVCGFDLSKKRLSSNEIMASREKYISKSFSISYENPIKITRGAMQYLFDDHGKTYIDAVNNVSHVGHCHPAVVKAINEQNTVLNTNTRYLHDNLVRYAERLTATMPDPLNVCFFVCSGSEANDLALRIARTLTGRKETIVLEGAYHGTSIANIEISPYKYAGNGGAGRAEYIYEVLVPDTYRGRYGKDDADAGTKYAESVKQAIDKIYQQNKKLSAFICESVLGCGGQIVLPEKYLREVYASVRNAGGICIADEVQVGFGRVGSHMWAFETQNVIPDIVTLGKPIGNGHPVAAVITTREIADAFANGMEYFNTFGGNPVSCAAGLAVLDVIEKENLQKHALKTGNQLLKDLKKLMKKHPIIGDVRGLGLFIGVELIKDRKSKEPAADEASQIINKMKDAGILISTDGPLHNVLKIKPPMVFTSDNAKTLVETLDNILVEMH
ncbi:MAG: aminotransferase class III-fold pyridoxal phosphate-dependent enzyme [Calditrichaceae bacterium]|nr:aminotransferase class III-fold pyridoxal phosphate-dependent enzyme [Calditrichaceae bacterium]